MSACAATPAIAMALRTRVFIVRVVGLASKKKSAARKQADQTASRRDEPSPIYDVKHSKYYCNAPTWMATRYCGPECVFVDENEVTLMAIPGHPCL
jgi:hypothetical protein